LEVLIPSRAVTDAGDPTGWNAAEALIGFIKGSPADMAERHDQHLAG